MEPALHRLLEPLAVLIGTWSGRGKGTYPTTEPFAFIETTTFAHAGKPFLSYVQRTSDAGSGASMHTEMGYWRVVGEGLIEMVISHAFGSAEISEGTFTIDPNDGLRIRVRSTTITATTTAKEVLAVERDFRIHGGELHYDLDMEIAGIPMTSHLGAVLTHDPTP